MSRRTLDIHHLLKSIPFKPESITVNGVSFPCMRIELPISEINPLEWLSAQSMYPKVYIETPFQDLKVAGIGEAFSIGQIPVFEGEGPPLRFFGGMDFDERKGSTWGSFPSCRYFLPLIEIEKRQGKTYLCINRVLEEIPTGFNLESSPLLPWTAKPVSRFDSPSNVDWKRHILESLKSKALEKIVLSRCTRLSYEHALSPLAICRSLQEKSMAATLFAFQFSPHQAFVGATPESLYKRQGSQIETAAIAGTRPRGKSKEEDQKLQEELLQNAKETYEFHIVGKEIANCLKALCTSFEEDPKNRIIQTSTVQHLYKTFKGQLKEGIQDKKLIEALHPTPALGGFPKHEALKEIRKRESFDRGWYGAPVGWISKEEAHLLVGIRSALVDSHELHLFAGAGIVQGSTPENEWQELEYKISQFLVYSETHSKTGFGAAENPIFA